MPRPILVLLLTAATLAAQPGTENLASYSLGPGDQVTLNVPGVEEFKDTPTRIEIDGSINLPLIGKIQAAGLFPSQLEALIKERLKIYVIAPEVIVTVAGFHSQPVMVIGGVGAAGIHQLEGRKTLFEILSTAGGVFGGAGPNIKITRRKEWGPIPLPGCVEDATGGFYIAEVSIKSIVEARNPVENIQVKPYDVITVPKAQVVYVVGSVKKAGVFPLGDAQSMTVLQALALSDGLDKLAAPRNARIMRVSTGGYARVEIPVDVKKIFDGKGTDVSLGPDDILFVPPSGKKAAAMRGLEMALAISSSVALLAVTRP